MGVLDNFVHISSDIRLSQYVTFNGNACYGSSMFSKLLIKMQVMALICIALMADLMGPMETTCIQVMEEVMVLRMEVMVGQCITVEREDPMVVMAWAWVLTIRVQIHLALLHHLLDSGCPSYEW